MAILKTSLLHHSCRVFLLALMIPMPAQSAPQELVKMAFLYNFSHYISWPESVFESEQSPFTICLNAEQKLITLLEITLKEKTINNRAYQVKQVSGEKEVAGCQIYFISAERYKENLKLSENQVLTLLTVSDYEGFAEQGGMIEIKQQDQRLKLLINLNMAKKSDLRIRSSLLNLMTVVSEKN